MPDNTVTITGGPSTSVTVDVDEAVVAVPGSSSTDVVQTTPNVKDVIGVAEQGPEGPAGTGDKTYVHTQVTPQATWTVSHGLSKFPTIAVVDSAESVVIGEIEYIDDNTCELTFSSAFGGKAYCN